MRHAFTENVHKLNLSKRKLKRSVSLYVEQMNDSAFIHSFKKMQKELVLFSNKAY